MSNNNHMPIRSFEKNFAGLLGTIYSAKSVFGEVFGQLQVKDGVSNNKTAFSVKTSNTPVVIGKYDTDENTAFGTGTANSSRFGERTEITYEDTDVPYVNDWKIHEGIDKATVNNNFEAAVADRLDLQGQAKVRMFNKQQGAYLVDKASEDLGSVADVAKVFNTASKKYLELEVDVPLVAYVSADIYNAIVDLPLTNAGKGSTISVDENGVKKFKGFTIIEVADKYLSGVQIIFSAVGIGIPYVGIVETRTIQSENFAGVALQGLGKSGQWISDDNLEAVFTAGKAKAQKGETA